VAGAGVYQVWRRLSRRPARSPTLEATRFVDAVEQQLARVGVRPRDGETLEDVSARLVQEAHPLAPAVSPLTRRYLEARFGQRPLGVGEASRMLKDLRQAGEAWQRATALARKAS
jgi:protein-glutamine gamma-glutamyltransferase